MGAGAGPQVDIFWLRPPTASAITKDFERNIKTNAFGGRFRSGRISSGKRDNAANPSVAMSIFVS